MKISGIYSIINVVNGKYYVGSSKDILSSRGRWSHHRYLLKENRHTNHHLQAAWNLYGSDKFVFLIVEELLPDLLVNEEQKYLDVAKLEKEKCYNQEFNVSHGDITEESRLKRSRALKGRVFSFSSKRKMSIAKIGIKLSDMHKKNISKSKIGNPHNPHTEETKQKMSNAQSGNKNARYDHTIHKWYNDKTSEVFLGTQYEFCDKFSLHRASVNWVVKGHRNSVYGWRICEDKI